MFLASQLLGFLLEPLIWVLVPLVAGVVVLRRRPRGGRLLCATALAALLLSGWEAVPNAILRSMELRYPPPPAPAQMQDYVGVVVLGGALSNWRLWAEHGQPALNEAAERMTAAASLAHRYPHLQLLFTGGSVEVVDKGLTEAERARQFFDEQGVPAGRVWYESGARTTAENATLSARVPGVDPRQRWLLLTSAYHMPRSMAVFEAAGWNVRPYPVDYRTGSRASWYDFSLHYGPQAWTLALHEWIGLLAYRWAGRA